MSNITLFKSGSLAVPDFLRESDEVTKLLAGGGTGKQISIKGGVWRMLVGGEEVAKNEERAMNVVVLAAHPSVNRTYYEGQYVEGVETPPSCWSADGQKPNPEVPEETRQSTACATCPQNIAGSGANGSRACRFSRRLAVALENDLQGNVYRLQLPAKSIFGKPEGNKMPLDAYAKFLSGHGVPITGVVTEMRFDTSEAVPVIKFQAIRPLQREEWGQAKAQAASEDAQRAIEFKMVPKPKDKDSVGAPPFAAAPAPAKAESVSEPVRRPSKKAADAATPASAPADVQDVLSKWASDDEA